MNQAKQFNDRYVTAEDIVAAGGKWDETGGCYVFPDQSTGRFTDIRDGGMESRLRFVGGATKPADGVYDTYD
jgi:hypothetical protein